MSDMTMKGYNGSLRFGRKKKYVGYNTAHLPTDAENDLQTPEQQERFSLYTPDQLAHETRTVRLEISFDQGRLHQTREQAKMIIEAMQQVILATRRHMISARGESLQRVAARKEAASCARALNILNGKQKAK